LPLCVLNKPHGRSPDLRIGGPTGFLGVSPPALTSPLHSRLPGTRVNTGRRVLTRVPSRLGAPLWGQRLFMSAWRVVPAAAASRSQACPSARSCATSSSRCARSWRSCSCRPVSSRPTRSRPARGSTVRGGADGRRERDDRFLAM